MRKLILIIICVNFLLAQTKSNDIQLEHNGIKFKKLNVDKDLKVMKRGCESGVTPLCNNLAVAYSKGTQTIQKDLKQYEYYLNKMCEQKDYKACDFVGKIYSNGYKEIKKDDKKSYQAFKIACDNANIDDSCFWVANFELFGDGGATRSFLKPERIYKRLCSKNHQKSCKFLKQFYKMVNIKTNRFYLAEKAKFEKQKQSKNYVIDPKTNLIWQDDSDTNTIKRNFKDAQKYCDELEMGGYDDWRLPNASELYSLVDETKNNNTNSIIKYSSFDSYISSTFYDEQDKTLWFIKFKNPHLRAIKSGLEAKNYVRCLRGKEIPLDTSKFYTRHKRSN